MSALFILLLAAKRREPIEQHLTPHEQYMALGVAVVVLLVILLIAQIARNS
jgi:hypothetical protein